MEIYLITVTVIVIEQDNIKSRLIRKKNDQIRYVLRVSRVFDARIK